MICLQEVIIAIIMAFDVQSGQNIGVMTAAFEDESDCWAMVRHVNKLAEEDVMLHVEGTCTRVTVVEKMQ